MKKNQQLSVLLLLFSFFAACTTEPIDPNLASQLAANNAANNNGGTNNQVKMEHLKLILMDKL